jgi:hypothetical protein
MTFINNIKATFDASADDRTRDSGELVSTIIMIAGFAIMSLLAINWLSTAVLNKAADVGKCIEGSNNYATGTMTAAACKGNTQTSFTANPDYAARGMK